MTRKLMTDMGTVPKAPGVPPSRLPGDEYHSVGRRWKHRRNLVIYLAAKHGASQRILADVFDMAHSRVASIIKEYRQKYEKRPINEED